MVQVIGKVTTVNREMEEGGIISKTMALGIINEEEDIEAPTVVEGVGENFHYLTSETNHGCCSCTKIFYYVTPTCRKIMCASSTIASFISSQVKSVFFFSMSVPTCSLPSRVTISYSAGFSISGIPYTFPFPHASCMHEYMHTGPPKRREPWIYPLRSPAFFFVCLLSPTLALLFDLTRFVAGFGL
jgi:hypothetical protein